MPKKGVPRLVVPLFRIKQNGYGQRFAGYGKIVV